MKKFVSKLQALPVAVSGLALGVAGLGNVLAMEVSESLRYICAAIASVILILVTIKKLVHPKLLWQEISHPVAGSFIPAFDMALMVVASVIAKHFLPVGQAIWYFAIVLHLVFAGCFFYQRACDFDLDHMLPSWFVPPIGIVVACVTGGTMNALPIITHTIFYFGFICYMLLLPIMLYRLIFGSRIVDAQLPAFAIMGAPASLCLAGYLTVFDDPNEIIVGVLLALALMMTALVIISMFRINHYRIRFIPIYASFTFPLAISATALAKYARFTGPSSINGELWHKLALAEMVLAIIVVLWVLLMMFKFVYHNVFAGYPSN